MPLLQIELFQMNSVCVGTRGSPMMIDSRRYKRRQGT